MWSTFEFQLAFPYHRRSAAWEIHDAASSLSSFVNFLELLAGTEIAKQKTPVWTTQRWQV